MNTGCSRCLLLLCLLFTNLPAFGGWGFNIVSADDDTAVIISKVADDSAAALAGLSPGDYLRSVNGAPANDPEQAVRLIRGNKPKTPLVLGIQRHHWRGKMTLQPETTVVTENKLTAEQQRLLQAASDSSKDKNYEQAVELCQKALNAGDPHSSIYYQLGWNLYFMEAYDAANTAISEAVKMSPQNANTLLTAGTIKAANGNLEAAKAYWRRASVADAEGNIGDVARMNLARAGYSDFLNDRGPPSPGRGDGHRVNIMVKPLTALPGQDDLTSGIDKLLLRGMKRSGYFKLTEGADDADVVLSGRVVKFDPAAQSFNNKTGLGGLPLFMSQSYSEVHLDIELRLHDRSSGKLIVQKIIPGVSLTSHSSMAVKTGIGKIKLPVTLEEYSGTPVERAIKDCLQKAVMYSVNVIPEDYFR